MKFVSTEALNWSSLPHFGHYSQPSCVFLTSFRPRNFVHSGLWLPLSPIILNRTWPKLLKWIKTWRIQILPALGKMPSHLRVFLLPKTPTNYDSDGMTSQIRSGCQNIFKTAASDVSFEKNFFGITGFSEAEISVDGKAECLPAIGQENQLSGVTSRLATYLYCNQIS